jgi:hypothetical protein
MDDDNAEADGEEHGYHQDLANFCFSLFNFRSRNHPARGMKYPAQSGSVIVSRLGNGIVITENGRRSSLKMPSRDLRGCNWNRHDRWPL